MIYLNYHEILPEASPYLYCLPLKEFESHLQALAGQPVGVTFDDGTPSQFEQAFPALERRQVKAIFFLTAGLLGNPTHMNWEQVRQLAEHGHTLGTHGWLHRFFTHCSAVELDEELRCAKQTVEDRTGRPVDALSFPGGRYDEKVLEACRQAGYQRIFTSVLWPLEWKQCGLQMFARYGIESGTSTEKLRELLRRGGRPSLPRRCKQGLKTGLRKALGDERYHRLWCLLAHGDPGLEQNAGQD